MSQGAPNREKCKRCGELHHKGKKCLDFSTFMREATPEQREKVFLDVARKASADQQKIMNTAYGDLANLIKLERIYMTTHKEGNGTPDNPIKEVKTFFNAEGDLIGRI